MLEMLLGSATAEKVLLSMHRYGEGYAAGIAANFSIPINLVQRQLAKFEKASLIVSRLEGRTRLYTWNPRYPFLQEIRNLLEKAIAYLPEDIIETHYRQRRRPRRRGKP